jgi:transcriptional regulator with XRE-family HTH domain
MRVFRPARKHIEVSAGESVRIIRELQGYGQIELSRRTGIPQATISAIENGRVRLGVERAKILARALRCHPAVLVFPGWQIDRDSAADPGRLKACPTKTWTRSFRQQET